MIGLSPLILASIRGEETMVRVLLDAGAETDSDTPPNCPNFPQANSEIQHWTALTFASLMGHTAIVKVILKPFYILSSDGSRSAFNSVTVYA
jgi:ankyrin repeat protein